MDWDDSALVQAWDQVKICVLMRVIWCCCNQGVFPLTFPISPPFSRYDSIESTRQPQTQFLGEDAKEVGMVKEEETHRQEDH